MKAIIIGGGIGGLASALALERVGIHCDVFEQADDLREVGSGLTVFANAVRMLKQLGVAERLLPLGSAVDRFAILRSDGATLSNSSYWELERKLGVPVLTVVHRQDLLRELASLVRKRRTHCGARCVAIENKLDAVVARFADGREASADLLVGADGLHSVVRAHLHGSSRPRYAGYTCWRGVALLELRDWPADLSFESWGPGARFSIHHCGPGRLFWYGTHNVPEGGVDSAAGRKADVLNVFHSWHSPIPQVIEATDEILRNDIVDRLPIRHWGVGRVTLLGDAAHPTTPNLGQGAGLALEDAVCLAAALADRAEIGPALRQYERSRRRRTAAITRASWRIGSFCQWENACARSVRDTLTRCLPAQLGLRWLESIVNYESTKLPQPSHPTG